MSERMSTERLFGPSGPVELIAMRARWAYEAYWGHRPHWPFRTAAEDWQHQLQMLDALCVDYLRARGITTLSIPEEP